jgi:hypothetical protein
VRMSLNSPVESEKLSPKPKLATKVDKKVQSEKEEQQIVVNDRQVDFIINFFWLKNFFKNLTLKMFRF